MTIPKNLEQLRDSIPAPKFTSDPSNSRLHAWEAGLATGFETLHSYLTEAAGEFDRAAFDEWKKQYYSKHGHFPDPWKCARWQFEQDRIIIAYTKVAKDCALHKIKQLEARVKELENVNMKLHSQLDSGAMKVEWDE